MIATVNREHGSTGVHTHTRALRDGLVAAGVAVDLVTPFSGSRAWLPLFAVRPLLLNRLNPTWATLWYRRWHGAAVKANLRRRISRGGVDRIIAQCPVSAAAALEVANGIPVTMVAHFNHSEAAEYRDQGVLAGEAHYRAMLAGEDDVLRRVDRVVYVSEWAKEIVERDRGVTPRASAVIRNGIAESTNLPPATRASIGLAADDVVLMSVGTLEPRKNQVALVEMLAKRRAAATNLGPDEENAVDQFNPSWHGFSTREGLTEVPGKVPSRVENPCHENTAEVQHHRLLPKLVLIGDGPDRPKLERRIAELKLTDRVVLLGHRTDVPALLPLADVYVHAALAENCPVAVIEAARAGLPWAAVPAAGMVELQRHLGGCVSLDELGSLVIDAARRAELGRAARANFLAGFTRTAMVRGYMDVLGDRDRMTVIDYANPPEQAATGMTVRDRFVTLLALVLAGYALAGRGFAYVGAPPLFIGEITLACGVAAFATARGWTRVLGDGRMWPLMALGAWGLARTLPFVSADPVNAIRDGMVWGYGTFALVMACLVWDRPSLLARLLLLYRRFVKLFLLGIPVAFVLYHFAHSAIPTWPWAGNIEVVQVKEGDVLVHLGGAVAFMIVGLMGPGNVAWGWVVLLTLDAGVMGVIDRAGMIAFLAVFGACVAFRPRSKIAGRAAATVFVVASVLWATNLSIPVPGGKGRTISFEQQWTNLVSTFGDSGNEGLDSNKEWRLNWWKEIRRYTLHGRYFWKGKGFGINLADDDHFQVLADHSLRNPHSVHMTMLARGGAPMFCLWALAQATFAVTVGVALHRARRQNQPMWEGLFFFLGAYWMAFLINASFDVFLEGPMGGIWFWTVYGTGIGAAMVHQRAPESLDGVV